MHGKKSGLKPYTILKTIYMYIQKLNIKYRVSDLPRDIFVKDGKPGDGGTGVGGLSGRYMDDLSLPVGHTMNI